MTFIGGRVVGPLDLAWCRTDASIEFIDTTFDEPVLLANAVLSSIAFRRCQVNGGIDANGIETRGDVNLEGSVIRGAIATTASITRWAAVWLCEASIGGRFLAVGARIEGDLANDSGRPARAIQADRLRVAGNIRFVGGFSTQGEVRLIGVKLGGSLDLTSCHLSDYRLALDLSEADVGGSLYILSDPHGDGPKLSGTVEAGGARIRGQTLVLGASFTIAQSQADRAYYRPASAGPPPAIRAPGAAFDGAFHIDGGTIINGSTNLAGARFGSHLDLGDSKLAASSGYALDLVNADVVGDLYLAASSDAVRLANARVGGSVLGTGTNIRSDDDETGEAVAGRGLRVEGDLVFSDAVITGGAVDLRLTRINGDLRFRGARLSNPKGQSLTITSAHLGASVFLDEGFRATGCVRLNRCVIDGRLTCDGGSFTSGGPDVHAGHAIEAIRTQAEAGMFLSWFVDGRVNFTSARTSILADRPDNWGSEYAIGGLIYTTFANRLPESADVDKRLAWLEGQASDDLSSYEQLAGYYQDHGRTLDAERVLIERNRRLRRQRQQDGGWRNRTRNLTDRLWEVSVGYGYRSSRAAAALLVLVLMTAGALELPAADDVMRTVDEDNAVYGPSGRLDDQTGTAGAAVGEMYTCGNGRVRCFSPGFYAIDTVVPLLDLQQRSTWYPDEDSPDGRLYAWGLNIAVLLGWATSSLLVLGVTQAVNPSRR